MRLEGVLDCVTPIGEMKCPRCVQLIHRSATQCPHCGFALQDLDAQYGGQERRMRRLSDDAGVLKMRERRKIKKWFDRFEATFPQLFFSVYYGALDDVANIRQFGMWLLNRGVFEDVSRPNEGGVLLVIDVNSKTAFMAHGYLLDFYLTEDDTFFILSKAHPHLLKGEHYKALQEIITQLTAVLKKASKKANRNPQKYQQLAGGGRRDQVVSRDPNQPEAAEVLLDPERGEEVGEEPML